MLLCNLCPSNTEQEILNEFAYLHLDQHIHKVTRFFTDKSQRRGVNIPIWRIQLIDGCDYMRILKMKNFLNQRVRFERIKTKSIPQCGNCQLNGQTSKFCTHPYRCVKCISEYARGNCPRDTLAEKDQSVACVNCKQTGHPANFRGCKIFTDLLVKKQNHKSAQQLKENDVKNSNSNKTSCSVNNEVSTLPCLRPPTLTNCGLARLLSNTKFPKSFHTWTLTPIPHSV